MPNMRKPAPRQAISSGPAKGCSIAALISFILVIVVVSILVASCSVPAGGGSGGTGCSWERERNKPQSHSLTIVGLTITGTHPRPKPGGGYRMPRVKTPSFRKDPGGQVKRTGKPVRMPTVKPPQPSSPAGSGYHWEYDCD